jgi:hypothetical protein
MWKKSTFSDAKCVEVDAGPAGIRLRDSKNPDGATLTFDGEEWKAFTDGVKAGQFD